MKKINKGSLITGVCVFLVLAGLSSKVGEVDTKKYSKPVTKNDEKYREEFISKNLKNGNISLAVGQLEFYEKKYPENKEKIIELWKEVEELKAGKTKGYEEVLKRTKMAHDEVEGIIYLYPEIYDFDWGQNILTVYLENFDKKMKMRLIIRYHGEKIIDFEKVTFNIDGNKKEIIFKDLYYSYDSESDTKSLSGYDHTRREILDDGSIAEWADVKMKRKYLKILEEIASSRKTLMRISGGNRQIDREISEEEKQAVKDILSVYNYNKKWAE